MGARSFTAVMAALAIVGLLAYGLISKGDGGVGIGSPAPDNTLTALGTDKSVSLEDYRGKWVFLNVFASWCPPCKGESPALQKFSTQNKGKVTVIGVDTRDLSQDGLKFTQDYGLTYPIWHDGDGDYAHDLGASGYPESFLVNPKGILVAHYPGAFRDEAGMTAFAQPALGTDG